MRRGRVALLRFRRCPNPDLGRCETSRWRLSLTRRLRRIHPLFGHGVPLSPNSLRTTPLLACEVSPRILIGAVAPHEVAFVENTSTALSLVAEGIDWRPGDNVVGAEGEFPSNAYPWMNVAARAASGVEYRLAPERDGRIDPEDLLARIDGRTRLLALSSVQYATGFRSDLARLGETLGSD